MDSFLEYHLCVSHVPETELLLNFIRDNPDVIYTNTGYEYTVVKGHHIHCAIIFSQKFTPTWTKKLERFRKKLNFVKLQSTNGISNDAYGWYFHKAKSDNNLAYILKKETKTKDNDEWFIPSITPELKTIITAYKEASLDKVKKHHTSKNGYTNDIIEYIQSRIKRAKTKNKKPLSTNEYIFDYYVDYRDKMPPPNIRRICDFVKFKINKYNKNAYMGILGIADHEPSNGYLSTDIDSEDEISDGEDQIDKCSTPPTITMSATSHIPRGPPTERADCVTCQNHPGECSYHDVSESDSD